MFSTWGHLSYRLRWWVLGCSAVFAIAAGSWGAGLFGAVGSNGFGDPASQSARAGALVVSQFPMAATDVVLIYRSPMTVDDPGYRDGVQAAIRGLPERYVRHASDYWTTGSSRLVSRDRHSTLVLLGLVGADEASRAQAYANIAERLGRPPAGFQVQRGGTAAVFHDINRRVESDVKRAEAVSFPALLVLLFFVIGGLVAASLPLVVGALAILGAFAVLHFLTLFTEISVFTINIVTMLGLGLAIDYALLMVTRFRAELGRTGSVPAAVQATVTTAGRTIAFSGITVGLSLAALLVFPQVYFRSMAMGGIAAAGIAVLASLTVLPALLSVLGTRVGSRRLLVPARKHVPRHRMPVPGAFYRLARAVMRRPYRYSLSTLGALLILAAPIGHATFGDIDVTTLPRGTESRVVAEQLPQQFPDGGADPIDAVVSFPAGTTTAGAVTSLHPYLNRLRALPEVGSVALTANDGATALVSVYPVADRHRAPGRAVVARVRSEPPPSQGTVLVGGSAAELSDLLAALRSGLPWLILAVSCVTLLMLFLAFGSVVLAVKAIVLSVLSLGASAGAIVWIFGDGHLAGVLDFTANGSVEPTQLVLLLVVAFALSTDYEMFVLSRIREEWDATGDNEQAVAAGVQSSAPVVTSAALLLVVVIGAFSASGISFLKMIGVGMVIAIVLDATVIRILLVPATMRLLGRGNWWAPRPWAQWWQRNRPHGAPNPPRPVTRHVQAATSQALPLRSGRSHRRGRLRSISGAR